MKDIIDSIEIKLKKFIAKHQQLKDEKLILEQENSALSSEVKTKDQQVLDLQEKMKLMNISNSVATSTDAIKATRMKINEYVREIDNCIALLNK